MSQTKFGLDQLNKKTPQWAKISLGVTLILTTAAAFIVSGDQAIKPETTVRVLTWLKGLDIVVLGLSQLFGVEVKPPTWTGKK